VNNEDSAIVVIMQRLAEEDTSGIIISQGLGYTHLMLPMRFEEERRCRTSIGFVDPRKHDGELLFPERFPEKEVKRLEKTMGTYAVAGQLQQRPAPRGGGLFEDKYLQLWPKDRDLPRFEFIIQSYDTAFTEKTTNDPTACTVWGIFRYREKKCALLLDAWDDYLTYPKLRKKVIADWKAKYGGSEADDLNPGRRADAVLVENKGSGISILQDLRAANIPAQKYNPGDADKVARAHQALPMYELACFYVLESKKEPGTIISWARPFAEELSKFGPTATKDNYVDTFTQMAIYSRDAGLLELPAYEEDEVEEVDYHAKRHKPNPYAQ
jgi:phage terminase large subunit-like protein